ncbi:SpaH/EbpB family LPXTG-anchored major pilin [Trueperella pyogenes]|uniref:SpaH/EbpB family LPXTG-anchored major pilin n=1 Tax=Trueperella pyogenes TaxID=1661 RepID=UPI003132C721
MFNHLRKAVVAALAAGALMLAGVAAHATTAPDSIVDANATGAIYLTKYDDAAGKKDADGTKDQDVAGAHPIDGIEFTLTPINGIDFSKNDDLKKAATLDAAKLVAGELPEGIALGNLGDQAKKVTTKGGQIHWSGLKVGAYLLQETKSKATDGKTYKAAAPSIVFIPTTDPKNQTSWIMDEEGKDKYAVYVYPKNSLDENVKKVVDKDVHVGGDVTFSVEASMPSPNKDEKINDFAFYDKLDPALDLDGKDNDVTVRVGAQTLAEDDFDVKIINGEQDELVVVLKAGGLDKATSEKAKNAAAKAVMTFKAKVLKAAVVPNQAQVYKNTGKGAGTVKPGETPKKPWEKTNTTVSAWGKVKIQKTDEQGNGGAKLNGAEFQVYKCDVADGKGKVTGKPLTVNGDDKFVTENDGTVTIDGLHVNDAENDKDVAATYYCLVETKAPATFELRHDPIPVQVKLTGVSKNTEYFKYDENGVLQDYSNNAIVQDLYAKVTPINVATDVVNIPVKPKLPMTGGAGVALFGILGLAIIGGGVYAAKRNTKKA